MVSSLYKNRETKQSIEGFVTGGSMVQLGKHIASRTNQA
jgi:hypothetical protein